MRLSDLTRGEEYASRALTLAKKIAYGKGMAISYKNLGWVCYMRGNIDTALVYCHNALQIFEKIGDRQGSMLILNSISTLVSHSDPEKAGEYAKQALTLALREADSRRIAQSYGNIGSSYFLRSDYKQALKYYQKALKIEKKNRDEHRVADSYNCIGAVYWRQGNYGKALASYLKSSRIRKKFGDKRGIAQSYVNIGNVYTDKSDYPKALEYYREAVKLGEEAPYRVVSTSSYLAIGDIYHSYGEYDEALKYYLHSLKISEEMGNNDIIACCWRNIGQLYYDQCDYKVALKYFLKCLRICQKIDYKENIAYSLLCIGRCHCGKGNYAKALNYGQRCLKIHKETGDRQGISCSYNMIGHVYDAQDVYDKALEYYLKSLKIHEEIGYQKGVTSACNDIAGIYVKLSKYDIAVSYLEKGSALAREIGEKKLEMENQQQYYQLYEKQGEFDKALDHHKKYTVLKEELFNTEKSKQITGMRIKYETEKKEKEAEIYHLKNVKLHKEIKERRKIEKELEKHRDRLEELVEKRTVELKKELAMRKRAEKKLLNHQQQLIALNHALSLVEEKQRRKTAAYLHDNISQALSLAIFKIRALQESSPAKNVKEELAEIREIVAQTNQRTRSLTFEISPPILYELGLEPAIEWLAGQFQTQHGIACSFKHDGSSKPLKDEARVLLFQAVRELLTNVSKHARAQTVKVSTGRHGNAIRISVEDDGMGFDPDSLGLKRTHNEGFGLFNIKERLRYLGGKLEVNSEKGKGTSVVLIVPLKRTSGNAKRKRR